MLKYLFKQMKIMNYFKIFIACILSVLITTNVVFTVHFIMNIRKEYEMKNQNCDEARFREQEDVLSEIIAAGWTNTQKSVRMKPRISEEISDNKDQFNQTDFLVPNVVHYTWLGSDLTFTFIHYLSFLSVHRYIKPSYIFVYGEGTPSGKWWNRTVKDVDNIIHVHRVTMRYAPSGKPVRYWAHASDILRFQILYKFGGIYLDIDAVALKSFDPLRRYQTVMGRETHYGISNGIIISAKGAPFIRMLMEQYESYAGKSEVWAYRSVLVPNILAQIFSRFVHIEETSLNRPNWKELDKIYSVSDYNWSGKYAMHLWVRLQSKEDARCVPQSVEEMDCNNFTIGQTARHVYYGSGAMMPSRCSQSDLIYRAPKHVTLKRSYE